MKVNKYLDWFIHMVGYALVLITVSVIFQKTIYIDNRFFGIWGLIIASLVNISYVTIQHIYYVVKSFR